ncbi:MAG TPA: nitrile hydratase accessory protein, partial [Actinomycetota bacterium]|nr:nitrile hydratase accessory protein [Actinomycetota bacterium]
WLAALERLIADKRLSDPAELARYRDAWKRAADRTPHGTPIELEPQDFG